MISEQAAMVIHWFTILRCLLVLRSLPLTIKPFIWRFQMGGIELLSDKTEALPSLKKDYESPICPWYLQ